MQRIWLLALGSAVLGACSGAATGPSTPPASIAGSWSTLTPGGLETPAGSEGLLLAQTGDSVTGTGQFAEFTYHIVGTYVRPQATLIFTDTLGGRVQVDTLTGRGESARRLILGGTTFYKQ
jgi:hypothetical protein